jgi:hypothetical protein
VAAGVSYTSTSQSGLEGNVVRQGAGRIKRPEPDRPWLWPVVATAASGEAPHTFRHIAARESLLLVVMAFFDANAC